uniref:Tryptophan synthase beta chain-like PALP domain-containing protein n=1 Tax=Amorphochlora amoebiformis TaxID=1561963 RepID=A0A7S0GYQ1_9EUKA
MRAFLPPGGRYRRCNRPTTCGLITASTAILAARYGLIFPGFPPALAHVQGVSTASNGGASSPVELFSIRGRNVYVKRDDLLRLPGSGISGNKARKLASLDAIPASEFPSIMASHGGIQSNAMLAMAKLAKAKGSKFKYITKSIPKHLKANPSGNYKEALSMDTQFDSLKPSDYDTYFGLSAPAIERGATPPCIPGLDYLRATENLLWIPQGGACAVAEDGVCGLADEIWNWWIIHGVPSGETLNVVLPAGTGTTALFLARSLARRQNLDGTRTDVRVFAVPCVGSADYLKAQMTALDNASGGEKIFPRILKPKTRRQFATPHESLYTIWEQLKKAGLDVDLVYAPPSWEALFDSWNEVFTSNSTVLYVHTGGLEGVSSMLHRYQREKKIPPSDC